MIFSPPFLWTLLGLLFIGAEMAVTGFVVFFFGVGALTTGILSAVVPGLSGNYILQGILWIVSTVLSFGFFRKKFTKIFKGTVLNRENDRDVGQSAVVIEAIGPDKPGRVRYQGTSWKAVSYTETFDPGEKVDIIKEDNLTFVVTKHFLDEMEDL